MKSHWNNIGVSHMKFTLGTCLSKVLLWLVIHTNWFIILPLDVTRHVQVSMSYGKLQYNFNGSSSPCTISKLSNWYKQIQYYVLTCPSVNFIWETPMSFQREFISMYNLKTKLQVAKHIKGHQNLVSILWKWDTRTGHHIGGMGHIKSGTPILSFNS